MKIAVFHELPKGGAFNSVDYISKELARMHTVDLFYVDSSLSNHNKSIYKKIFFYKFNPKEWFGSQPFVRFYKDTIELYKLDRLHKKISLQIDKNNYDYVFVHGSRFIEAPFILRHIKTKTYFYCHNPGQRKVYEKIFEEKTMSLPRKIYNNLSNKIITNLDRVNFNNADYILSNTIYTKKNIKNIYGRDSKVCYLGVDIAKFKPNNKIKKIYDVLYVGSMHKVDGYDLLNKISNVKKKLNVRTVFYEKEWLSKEDLIAEYQKSKIVVCLAKNEPFGLTVIESMACGVPVIAVNQAGYMETVENNSTGLLIARDPNELIDAIKSLLDNKIKLDKFSVNSRKSAIEKWSWEVRGKEFRKILI